MTLCENEFDTPASFLSPWPPQLLLSPFISTSSLLLLSALVFLGLLANVASRNLQPSAFPGVTLGFTSFLGLPLPRADSPDCPKEEMLFSHYPSGNAGGGWGRGCGLHWPPPSPREDLQALWVGGRKTLWYPTNTALSPLLVAIYRSLEKGPAPLGAAGRARSPAGGPSRTCFLHDDILLGPHVPLPSILIVRIQPCQRPNGTAP